MHLHKQLGVNNYVLDTTHSSFDVLSFGFIYHNPFTHYSEEVIMKYLIRWSCTTIGFIIGVWLSTFIGVVFSVPLVVGLSVGYGVCLLQDGKGE